MQPIKRKAQFDTHTTLEVINWGRTPSNTIKPDELAGIDDNLTNWIDALRSGKYKQAKNLLRRGDTFCCLGVACELLDPDGWRTSHHAWDQDEGIQMHRGEKVYPSSTFMHQFGSESAGRDIIKTVQRFGFNLRLKLAKWDAVDATPSLGGLNDEEKWGFRRISNLLEFYQAVIREARIEEGV